MMNPAGSKNTTTKNEIAIPRAVKPKSRSMGTLVNMSEPNPMIVVIVILFRTHKLCSQYDSGM